MSQPASTIAVDAQHAAAYEREVAPLPEAGLEALLLDAGFADPVRFSQSLLIHAWFARRP